jgi:hypothetical protein
MILGKDTIMLIQLTYASRTSRNISQSDLAEILAASQRNNARVGVTGALCLANGIFLQQLEGDRAEVNRLYHRAIATRPCWIFPKFRFAALPAGPWAHWHRWKPTAISSSNTRARPVLTPMA